MRLVSSPGLPRLFVTASDVKAGRPGRFLYIRLRQVDTNVTSCQLAAQAFEPVLY